MGHPHVIYLYSHEPTKKEQYNKQHYQNNIIKTMKHINLNVV